MRTELATLVAAFLLTACQAGEGAPGTGPTTVFDEITADEVIYLTGTEPFWGGEIEGTVARYSTPENPEGKAFDVERFAGNNGLAFTGRIDGSNFDLMVTPGDCSDGMSDRIYPFTATLKIGDEQRNGCAWTDAQEFTGPENP